jgi:hypothetical protein
MSTGQNVRVEDRLTVMVCFNMTGTNKFLVIVKSQKPMCFKNVKSLPVQYFDNKKTWMTSVVFETWLLKVFFPDAVKK